MQRRVDNFFTIDRSICWAAVLQYIAFAAILLGIKLWLINTYGNATPFWDQWDAEAANLYKPFLEGTLGWANLLSLHNEHRIFTTRLLALALLIINGIWNPLLQMVVNAVLHIFTLGLCIVLLIRVIGRNHLSALLSFSVLLFGVPYGWENTLAGFQAQFYFVILFSIACLWLTVTNHPFSASWWGGVVCAILAFLSLASGIFALAASAIIGFVFYAMGLRKTNKQLLAVAILAGLFVLGAVLTPSLAYHAPLKAASFMQFFYALMAVLGWPISSNFLSALIRNLPALMFIGFMFWKRPPAKDCKWFLLAFIVWGFGQAVCISYGRAIGNLSSRYLDLFALFLLVNFACLIYLGKNYIGQRRGLTIIFVTIWTVTVLISLGLGAGKRVPVELAAKRNSGMAQEINTRNYLATGDFSHLKNKPFLQIPYPSADRLASILASPSIRSILPANIRPSMLPVSIESKPANAFVANGYYPSTPERTGITLGSYSTQGDAATGQASLKFNPNLRSGSIAIPVAGYPLSNGMGLEIEQNNQRKPVDLGSSPKESWGMAYAKVDGTAFSLYLLDESTTTWLAVGVPVLTGRLDALINTLLANYYVFLLLGFVVGVLLVTQGGLMVSAN